MQGAIQTPESEGQGVEDKIGFDQIAKGFECQNARFSIEVCNTA